MTTLSRYLRLVLALAVLAGSGCTKEARKKRHLERADRDYKAEQYAKAEIEYLNALKVAPLNPEAIRHLGFIYQDQGRLPLAFAYLRKAAELEPDNPDVRAKLGLTYLTVGQFKEANEEAARALDKQPGHAEALLLLAESAITTNQLRESRQRIGRLSQADKNRAVYYLALGTLSLQERQYDKAEIEIKKALELDPKFSAAYVAFGNLHWLRNDLKQADQAFKTAAEFASAHSPRRLKYADFKLKTGATDEAKKILEAVTRQTPDYLPAWNSLMQVAFAERKYDDCVALVEKVVARDPMNLEALLMRGKVKLSKGEGAKALPELERLSTLYPGVPRVQYQLSLAYLANDDLTKAMNCLNQAKTLDPNYAEATLLLAELNIRKGQSAAAITSLAQLVKQQPQLAQAHLLLASAYLMQKEADRALGVYRQMSALFPKNAEVPYLSATVLAQQNKRAEARKAFERTLELAPDYLPAVEQLVNLDLADKQYAAALSRATEMTQKHPKAADPWLLVAKVHLAQKDTTQGEAALLKAIEVDPSQRNAYLLLAQVYVAGNKHQQALDRLTSLISKTNDVQALMQMGMINQELKQLPAARDAYEKLLTVNPRFSPALNNLAYLYSEHFGQLDKAYEMANRARQLLPSDPATADTLGWILYKKGDLKLALGLLEESAGRLPAEPEVQFHLGMTQYMVGSEESARLTLQRAVQSSRDFPGKEEAKRRLDLLAIDAKTASPSVLAALEKSLQQEPNDPVVASRLAKIYDRDGSFDKAIAIYEKMLKGDPQNASAMGRLAQLYSSYRNDSRKALELAKNAHNLASEDPLISRLLARLVYEQKDFKWALSLYQEAARKLGKEPELLAELAWAYYSMGRVEEAESTMKSAIETGSPFSKREEAKRFLAMVAAVKDTTQAGKIAAQVHETLKVEPKYLPALMISASLQEQAGQYEQARGDYETILESNPLFTPATRNLALLLLRHGGDDKKVYDLTVKAREAFPADPEVARALGILACRRGDAARGAQLLKELAQERSEDAELLYYLGMAQYQLKQPKESKQTLQRALALNVEPKLADQAKRVLIELK